MNKVFLIIWQLKVNASWNNHHLFYVVCVLASHILGLIYIYTIKAHPLLLQTVQLESLNLCPFVIKPCGYIWSVAVHLAVGMCSHSFIHSFTHLACAERNNSLPFSGASSIPLCYVLFPATLLHQLLVHPLSPHLAIYFVACLSILLFPNLYIIPFGNI